MSYPNQADLLAQVTQQIGDTRRPATAPVQQDRAESTLSSYSLGQAAQDGIRDTEVNRVTFVSPGAVEVSEEILGPRRSTVRAALNGPKRRTRPKTAIVRGSAEGGVAAARGGHKRPSTARSRQGPGRPTSARPGSA